MASAPQKYRIVRDALLREIRAGAFAPGARLPAERELAAQFDVSHMTARRAVGELVEDGLLERRPPLGTFVRDKAVAARTVNIICPGHEHPLTRQFIAQCVRQIEARGAHGVVVSYEFGNEYSALRALHGCDQNLVLLDSQTLDGPLAAAVVEARQRSVLIGNRLDAQGVHSVMTDETTATLLALECLRRAGHRRVALICDDPQTVINQVRISVWREAMQDVFAPKEMDEFLIAARTPRHGDPGKHIYVAMLKFLKERGHQVTALLTAGILQVVAVVAACRDADSPVPEKLALVNGVDNSILEFSHPAITCVDNALGDQVQLALQILQELRSHRSAKPALLRARFHQVEPHLIERESVLPLSVMQKIVRKNTAVKTPPLRRSRLTPLQEVTS